MAPSIKSKPAVKLDKVAQIREWLKTQSPETQTRLGDLLEKGAIKEVEAGLPAGWASKENAVQSVPNAETTETKAPKAKGLKSVASNPAAKATKDAVAAEVKAASEVAEGPVKSAAKGIGAELKNIGGATKKGLGKLADSKVGKAVMNNKLMAAYAAVPAIGRALEVKSDMDKGQSFGEAVDKPESNKKLARAGVDALLAGLGSRGGAMLGSRIGAPMIGSAAGGVMLPMVGDKAMDAMNILKPEATAAVAQQKAAPAKNMPPIGIDEASNWLRSNNMDATEGNFQKAFQELSKKQQEQINKTPEPKPSADTYKPSAKESMAMAEQAVKAPIGSQERPPEPDIMSFLSQPDTQNMLAELAAKQANQVQSASSIPSFKPRKKNNEEDDEYGTSSTTTASVRPPPRFFVNTGRFGTMAGGGSRRSPSGRLL